MVGQNCTRAGFRIAVGYSTIACSGASGDTKCRAVPHPRMRPERFEKIVAAIKHAIPNELKTKLANAFILNLLK
jgi:hypothetical protein